MMVRLRVWHLLLCRRLVFAHDERHLRLHHAALVLGALPRCKNPNPALLYACPACMTSHLTQFMCMFEAYESLPWWVAHRAN